MATWRPTADDLARVLSEQNPWHASGDVPRALAPTTERTLVEPLSERLVSDDIRRFQVVLGHRRVGKTTAMYHLVRRLLDRGIDRRRIWWHRLDHPVLMDLPLGDLVRFGMEASGATAERPAYILLDEVVYARDWDRWLKTFHDDRWPVRIVATASATAALRNQRPESGIGRWEEHHLSPYLLDEYLALRGGAADVEPVGELAGALEALARRTSSFPDLTADQRRLTLIGGFPELLAAPPSDDERSDILRAQAVLRSDAVERAVYKDIPQSFGIDNPMLLERLLYTLAGQMTGILGPAALSSDLGMSQPTFDRYLGYLGQAFLTFVTTNFSGNEAKAQRRGRKLFFVDGAVRNAALQRGIAPLDDPVELGHLTENLVAGHLRSLGDHSQVRLHHWRSGKDEVDLVFAHPAAPVAMEVASSTRHHRRGLEALVAEHPRFHGHAYLVAPGATAISADRPEGIGTLPLGPTLLTIGIEARAAQRERLRS